MAAEGAAQAARAVEPDVSAEDVLPFTETGGGGEVKDRWRMR